MKLKKIKRTLGKSAVLLDKIADEPKLNRYDLVNLVISHVLECVHAVEDVIDNAITTGVARNDKLADLLPSLHSAEGPSKNKGTIPEKKKAPEPEPAGPPKKRRISPEGLAHIAAAQKKRWAAAKIPEYRNQSGYPAPVKKKRKLSPEGRRNIQAALKKRWAEKRAAAATTSKRSPTKKAA